MDAMRLFGVVTTIDKVEELIAEVDLDGDGSHLTLTLTPNWRSIWTATVALVSLSLY